MILFHHSFISNFVKFTNVQFCKSYYTIIDVVLYPNVLIVGFIIRDLKKAYIMYMDCLIEYKLSYYIHYSCYCNLSWNLIIMSLNGLNAM